MKRAAVAIVLISLLVVSCATAIRRDLIQQGIRDLPIAQLEQKPDSYTGRLFVLGGIIVSTRLTQEGSVIEAVYVPVDSSGYLLEMPKTTIRFKALYPRSRGYLDPAIYRANRTITLAGTFTGLLSGKIDEMEYTYHLFRIEDLHLWQEREHVAAYNPDLWGPWGPYPYWRYPYARYPYGGFGSRWWW
jgi:outer membrane lipoprotein